ncbi:MAG: CHAD domain-containing protein [Moraxellaceae bacterium]|nr:CHAD domain-containing protein [Moraxellaceae bacterium]
MPDKYGNKLIAHAQALHQSCMPLLVVQVRLSSTDVHQLRVLAKELRALWQLLKPLLAKGQADAASRSIWHSAKLLADVRDQQVQLDTLDQQIGKAGEVELPALRRARAQLITQAGCSKQAVVTAAIASAFAQDLTRWQALELDSNKRELIGDGYERLYRNACKRYLHALESGNAEDWHKLRRWTKYLALVTPVIVENDGAKILTKRYCDLAEKLGDLHDLEVLTAALRVLPDQDKPSMIQAIAAMEQRADSLQRKCCRKARRLFGTKSKSGKSVL